MNIWVQSLSWTLIYAIGQGLFMYALLRVVLLLIPPAYANARYHCSLSALAALLAWFVATWVRQYHDFSAAATQLIVPADNGAFATLPLPAPAANAGQLPSLLLSLKAAFPLLSALYVAGVSFMLLRVAAGVLHLSALCRKNVAEPGASLGATFHTLKARMGIDAPVRLLLSATAKVPMVIGWFKPVILLPVSALAQLSAEQTETILLHELAHLKRNDYIINILQVVTETVLFFNPFAWLISATCRQEREHSCDDIVLQHIAEPITYADALTAIARSHAGNATIVVAATGKSSNLYHRIIRIMETRKNQFSYSKSVAGALMMAAIVCSVAWIPPIFGNPEKDKAATPTATPAISNPPADGTSEQAQLVNALMKDGMVDQIKGFLVETRDNALYIDGQKQPDQVSQKYLLHTTQEHIRVQVFPFVERLQMHPDAGFIQLLLPVSNSSGCVDMGPKKEGC